jgi:2-polyprenyl-3-methyl-5-hydroxy-6-metoxy-1,4-benzoquinol methylase
VLDVGSGPGVLIDHLPEDFDYVGIDVSAVARESIENRGGRAYESLDDLNGERFDGCVLGEFLEHLEDDRGFLRQIRERLTTGALLVASVPRFGAMSDPAHTRDYTATEFKELLSTVGEVRHSRTIGPWLICEAVVR